MVRLAIILTVLLACSWAGSGDARAAVVTSTETLIPGRTENVPKVGPQHTPASLAYAVSIAAGASEINAVTVEVLPSAILVRDAVAVTPGAGCEAVDALSVRCPTESATTLLTVRRAIAVTLGDGDDRLEAPAAGMQPGLAIALKVDAGDGNDVVVAEAADVAGGSGDDRLIAQHAAGGSGNDVIHARAADGGEGDDMLGPLPAPGSVSLRGGPGNDVLAGGPTRAPDMYLIDAGEGDDRVLPGEGHAEIRPGPGADVIDGGGGNDHVSFAYATRPVQADLATPGPVDPTGEGDAMTGVESVEGGSGDDVLLGGDDGSLLVGGDGDDRLDGRGGRDVIVGGRGADTISGGAGDDNLASGSGSFVVPDRRDYTGHTDDRDTDVVTGGAGADLLRVGTGDRGDAGAGADMVVAEGRPARVRCGSGERDRFDGLRVPRDCERVLVFSEAMPTRVRLRAATLTVPVTGTAPVRVVVAVDGRVVARRRTRTPQSGSRSLRLRIAIRHLHALRRASVVRLTFTNSFDEAASVLLPGPSR